MQMGSLIVQEWKLALGGAMQQTSVSLITDILLPLMHLRSVTDDNVSDNVSKRKKHKSYEV